ncbi:MAG: AsmA family protein [Flavobacteriales bacterium]|nr:AsmA family protein [Flavobacteriales bacterium]
MKKILIGLAAFIILCIIALVSIPFLFKDKIQDMVLQTINNEIDATVHFDDVDLSVFQNFPNASVSIKELSVINKAPFEGDTLVYFKAINLEMSISELFKEPSEGMNISSIGTETGTINIKFNKEGKGNFDIAKPSDEESTSGDPFILNLQNYYVHNLQFHFIDEASQMSCALADINHTGTGDFSGSVLDLNTQTTATLSFDMEGTNYMDKIPVKLDAIFGIDLDNSKYTFKDNKAIIRKLPFEFEGFVQMKEDSQEYDLKFKTPNTSFNNLFALIPTAYSGAIENIKTTGEFSINGFAKGQLTEELVPTFGIDIVSQDASFQFPELPKAVQHIHIDTRIENATGLLNDTKVAVNRFAFQIEKDVFDAKALISNSIENPKVSAQLDGIINLENVTKAYPVEPMKESLTGILTAHLKTAFDMASVEAEKYENIKNEGSINLKGFHYAGPELAKPMDITETTVTFNTENVVLEKFNAKTGSSDMQIAGKMENLYGFLFKDQILRGNFTFNANHLAVADFMAPTPVDEQPKEKTTENASDNPSTTQAPAEAVKIPSFLDCTFTAKANTVVYDNITMKDVSGKMIIKDEQVKLENLKSSMFGGLLAMNGMISTQKDIPTFEMTMDIKNFDITESFGQMEFLNSVAPIAKTIVGRYNSKIALAGNLDSTEMTPDLYSLSGDLLGQLLDTKVKKDDSKALTALDNNLSFIDVDKLNLNNVEGNFYFKDGKVNLKPTDIEYNNTKMVVQGSHGFDQSMNYDIKFNVPAKYLGAEVTDVLKKLNIKDAGNTMVPVNATLTGTFKDPKLGTDLKQSVKAFTTQLIKDNKEQLISGGVKKAAQLSGIKGAEKITENIPTSKEELKEKATEKVNEEVDKAKDKAVEKAKEEAKNKAGNAIKGLFGR